VRGGFAVGGCLEGGGGGCKTSGDDDEVVSIDKERVDFKGDVMWRRDACEMVDNMVRVCMRNAFAGRSMAIPWPDRSRVVPRGNCRAYIIERAVLATVPCADPEVFVVKNYEPHNFL
jgi:hypothetical protein